MYGESDPLNQNCDSEVNIIIGKLLEKSKGDNVVISILSSFNHAVSVSKNAQVLNSSKFPITSLERCAEFLNIKLADDNNLKLLSNKLLRCVSV